MQFGGSRPRVAYPSPPCDLMANINVIGSLEGLKPEHPWESLHNVPLVEVNTHSNDKMSFHFLTGLVPPGKHNRISMTPHSVKELMRRHLSYISNVIKHPVPFFLFETSIFSFCQSILFHLEQAHFTL